MTTCVRLNLTTTAPVSVEDKGKQGTKNAPTLKARKTRTQARAVKRIFDKTSGDLVGWLYEWNTGEIVPRWKSKVHKNVYYD